MNGSSTYQRIVSFYPNEEKRLKFISLCVLTFGLRLDSLTDILQLDKDYIFKKLTTSTTGYEVFIHFKFFHGFDDQELAKKRFYYFLNSLYMANRNNDAEQIRKVLSTIYDADAKKLSKRKEKDLFTDDNIKTILEYQKKYGLNNKKLAVVFNTDRNLIVQLAGRYFINHPEDTELKSSYEFYADYFQTIYKEGR